MEVSPLRALTLHFSHVVLHNHYNVEMEVSPLRALTQPCYREFHGAHIVEMEVSPLRALTLFAFSSSSIFMYVVEMEVSPLRALTHFQFFFYYGARI